MKFAIAGCTALAAAVTVWRLAGTWALLPFLALVVVAAALAWIDLTQRRLPNRIVLPALGASVPVLLFVGGLDRWLTSLAGAALLFALYLLLALVSPQGMGMGDVKLAALVGLYAGYLGWSTLFVAAFAGFVLGGVAALVVVRRMRSIPFGPWMLLGLWAGIALAPTLTR
jgi:leader peptidase (prepilin peptidase)/N-methyltransferase